MTGDRLRAHLDDGEPLEGCWTGRLSDGWRARPTVLGATDRRLVWLDAEGAFGALPYDHVSAVEARREVATDYEGLDYRLVVGGGGLLALLGFVAAVLAGSGLLAMALVLASVGGVGVAEHGWRNRESYDGVRRVETERRRLVVRTTDGRDRRFAVRADAGVDAELGRLVARDRTSK